MLVIVGWGKKYDYLLRKNVKSGKKGGKEENFLALGGEKNITW